MNKFSAEVMELDLWWKLRTSSQQVPHEQSRCFCTLVATRFLCVPRCNILLPSPSNTVGQSLATHPHTRCPLHRCIDPPPMYTIGPCILSIPKRFHHQMLSLCFLRFCWNIEICKFISKFYTTLLKITKPSWENRVIMCVKT